MWEVISEVILITIFAPVGAFYRWLSSFGGKPYRYYLNLDGYFNGTIGMVVTALLVMLAFRLFG